MGGTKKHTFPKAERLSSRIVIERLFSGGGRSLPIFPLRIVYMPLEEEGFPAASVLVIVPKRRFKKAVDRNRVKRQIREAYRKNKEILLESLNASGRKMAVALIWIDNRQRESAEVEAKVKRLLQLVSERIP